jgi:hypothetical protein
MAKKSPSPKPEAPVAPAAAPDIQPFPAASAPKALAFAAEVDSGIEVIADRSCVLIVAEVGPGQLRWIDGIVDGRIQASDTRKRARPMAKPRAQAILAEVRQTFPNAQIQFVD